MRGRWSAPGAVGLALGAVVLVLARRVFGIVEDESWPPGPGAITSAGAQRAVEERAELATSYAWSRAAAIEPWPEGVNFFPRMFEDARAARSSIHVLMFGWREGTVGTAFADLLVEKLGEGVAVRVLVDGQGSHASSDARPMFDRLRAAGAEIVVKELVRPHPGRVDHRKLYVFDGTVAWTGGAGLEDHFENGRFHDVMVRVTGDVVRQAQALFLTSFRAQGGVVPTDLDGLFPAPSEPGTIPIALLQVVPGGFQSATQAIRELIDRATTRLDVMNPYLTDRDIIRRVEAAARRGVAVRIVVAETSNNALASLAFKHHYPALLDAGAEIYEYPGAVVHAKLVVADDAVLFGTVNLDAWALYRNYEVAMLARDAPTCELFEQRIFEPDIAKSRRPEPATRFANRLANRISYFL